MRIEVLGVGFDNVTMDEAVDRGMTLEQAMDSITDDPVGKK